MLFLLILSLIYPTMSWPDGAPCVHAAYESMNPLEAVEHQGGLQLSVPPYEIKVDQKCYWRNQPIGITLQGLNESVWFKGFVIQPFEWDNGKLGDRMGQLMRLDDNGSWQQQCFRYKNSATHSHDENKKHMRMWWKADEDSRTVQFVATVVKHQTMFWVRSVLSTPIPPCRISRFGIINYVPPLPTVPPPVKLFKMETNRVFGNERITPLVGVCEEMNGNVTVKKHIYKVYRILQLSDGFHAIPAKEQNVNNVLPEQNGAGPIIPNLK
uniref:Reelin domain-containing protein n=1 Tax=Heterorhabditis bacteriophora TaxID=37862 RepID=A0A1I7XFG0_HETBA